MKQPLHRISAKLWIYPGENPWHFITIERPDAERIRKDYIWPRRGFGSIPVHVTIGKTTWKTSIFPDKGGAYLLPVKKDVRIAECIADGDTVTVTIRVIL